MADPNRLFDWSTSYFALSTAAELDPIETVDSYSWRNNIDEARTHHRFVGLQLAQSEAMNREIDRFLDEILAEVQQYEQQQQQQEPEQQGRMLYFHQDQPTGLV